MSHLIYNGIKECNCLTCRELAATKRELVDFQLAAHAEAERVDELTEELAATKREFERWKHGTQIEGDYICPSETLQGIPIPVPASARGPERDTPRDDEPTVVRRLTKAMREHKARRDVFSRSGYACTLTLEPVGDGNYRMVAE